MRSAYSVFALLAVLPSAALALAQNTGSSNAPPIRDPQAIGILTEAVAAAGAPSAIEGIEDFTALGNVQFYWSPEPVNGTATIRGRGLHQFRVDVTLPSGVNSWIVNGNAAFQREPDGSSVALPPQDMIKPAPVTFPLLQVVNALQDTTVSVSYGGLVAHNGQQVHDVLVQKTFSATSDPQGATSDITKAHIFIDPSALTVQSIDDAAYRRDGEPGASTHEMQFSAYQGVNGILVPFSITELIAGQQTASIQLNQIAFNTGLTDADFE